MTRLLLCTDMDRTAIPNGFQSERPSARKNFNTFCGHPAVSLVYVTGRHLARMEDAIQQYDLPEPDYAVTDVGTKIYHRIDQQWHSMTSWEAEIDQAWQHIERHQIIDSLQNIRGLTLQESEKQNTHKISYYADLDSATETSCLEKVRQSLAPLKVETSLVWSINETSHTGLLDILPPNATKLHAIEFLQQRLDYSLNEVVFAGDSGNDMAVLTSKIPSVLVANATNDVKRQAKQLVEGNGTQDQFFQAVNEDGQDGNYSAGILQGVFHFRPELKTFLPD